ncbi:MAG: S-methyl-5-thioribose-1-phosphate isomerase [Clostridia bacterium]|nr:S-methyl-5-thioribose-1-phosphate isomerase [Clostridia bacterium]
MENIRLSQDRRSLIIADQTKLPNSHEYIELKTAQEFYDAIYLLKIRGAPAIGVFAGYAACILGAQGPMDSAHAFIAHLEKQCAYLNSSRPTAVNLSWATGRILSRAKELCGLAPEDILPRLFDEAAAIHDEDMDMCRRISEYGLSLLKDGDGVLTHCNAGPLATSRYGTGQGPLFLALEKGVKLHVFADETRPLLQGARLTAYELHKAGADVTLICDNMASIVMKNGWISACMVGCDRVAANGDVANKIGTSGVAILAKHYGIPFYVLGPTSTIDMSCPTGEDIKIELRPEGEIREKFYSQPMALPEVKCYNPAFDVTDNSLITAIITEKGICRPPYAESLKALFE